MTGQGQTREVIGLRDTLEGNLLQPGDDGYEDARSIWNVRFDRRPDLIARCAKPDDVRASIDFARENGLTLSVKGGGHSYAAKCVADSGLLVDLSLMNSVEVDAPGGTATIGPGVTCGLLDAATQSLGVAVPTPTVSSVGVIGAALGGGSGYLARRFGLALDNLMRAEVVTADGDQVTASADENPDLFWALRGGGGNFGVVTSATFRVHEVGPQVLKGQIIYPFDSAGDHLRFFREFMEDAPDDFQCYPFTFRVPPIELFPEETHGDPVLDFVFCHQDPEALEFVEPLRGLGEPILDLVGSGPYVETQTAFDANLPKGQRYMSKAHDLDELSEGAIDTMVEYVPQMVGAFTAAYFDPLGGAIGRVGETDTAYAGRQSAYGFHALAGWVDPEDDDEVIGWVSEFHTAMAGHANGGVYVNLIADDEDPRIPDAYGENYTRLRELKAKWDPTNLFASNYNIPPA